MNVGRNRRIWTSATAAAASLLPPAAAHPALAADRPACTGQAYVSVSSTSSLAIVDTAREAVLTAIPVGRGPVNPVITPDGTRVYVANSGDGTISIVDAATRTLVSTIPAGGPKPTGLAFTPDGKKLVITYFGPQPPRSEQPPSIGSPTGVVSTPVEGGRILSLFGREVEVPGSVRILTLATGAFSDPIAVGGGPERLALTPDGRRAYVANLHSGTISVVDLDRRSVIATIATGHAGPFNVRIPRSGKRVFVGHTLGNVVAVIDTATNKMIATLETNGGPNGMAFGPDHAKLYVTNFRGRSVQALDTASHRMSAPAPVGDAPGFIALTGDGKKAFFVRPYGTSISVLDLPSMTVKRSIEVGRGPSVIAICGAP